MPGCRARRRFARSRTNAPQASEIPPCRHLSRAGSVTATDLLQVQDVRLGVYEEVARNENNPLVRTTASRRRQFRPGVIRNVNADHGEIARLKLEDVRAVAK